FRFSVENSPWLCLSYVADEAFVRTELNANQNPLFARDAISARVIIGDDYFGTLLRQNSWMAQYFPKLYNLRVRNYRAKTAEKDRESPAGRIVNLFLYYIAGSYIKVKSHLLNRKFMKMGKKSSLFQLRIGPDHCIYESADYVNLKSLYSRLKKSEVVTTMPVSQ
ncbi:MAG: hypothetical protein ACHQ1H_03910, partial [Nitrososphaerales archaeon]